MTNTIKVSDVSVEKAIQKGLRQLGLPQDQVFVEVISEGKKDCLASVKKMLKWN